MCTAVGVVRKPLPRGNGRPRKPTALVAARLLALIAGGGNRGEKGAGAVTFDHHGHAHHVCRLGPPAIFRFNLEQEGLRKVIPGHMGIGHTRYPTAGRSSLRALQQCAQPRREYAHLFGSRTPTFFAENGDTANPKHVRAWLHRHGITPSTSGGDAELLHLTLVHLLEQRCTGTVPTTSELAAKIFSAVRELHRIVVGGFSNVFLCRYGLVAWRAMPGIRPLQIAEKRSEDGELVEVAVASETGSFHDLGDYTTTRSLEPGEIVFVTPDLEVFSSKMIELKPAGGDAREAFCFFEYDYFARPDSSFHDEGGEPMPVEGVRRRLAMELAEEFICFRRQVDVVVGVPATAVSAGIEVAQVWGVPYRQALIKKGTVRSFQETSDARRQRAIDGKMMFIRRFIRGKRVALIDDSNVRGNTAKKIVARLKELGAEEVHYFFYTPPLQHPCFFGIDIPDPGELTAARCHGDSEAIAAEMGATSVHYLSLERHLRGLGVPREKLCDACLTGEYPVDISEAGHRATARRRQRRRSA